MIQTISLLILLALPLTAHSVTLSQLSGELAQKKYAQAAITGNTILLQQPQNPEARFLTALALQKSNKLKQAEQHYLKLIKAHPEFPEPRNNLAMIYLDRGMHDEAAGLLIASLKTHPSYAIAWKNLSDLYKGLASEAYRKALGEESPESALDNIKLSEISKLHSLPRAVDKPVIHIAKVDKKPQPAAKPSPVSDSPSTIQQPPLTESNKPQTTAAIAASTLLPESSSAVEALQLWASAWSSKAIDDYISAYTADYKGRENNRQQWLKQRKSRINRPGEISVTLSNIQIRNQNKNRITIDAQQSFQSPNYSDRVVKRFNLTKIKGQWKISRERTLTVL